jgi:hypothetical protein
MVEAAIVYGDHMIYMIYMCGEMPRFYLEEPASLPLKSSGCGAAAHKPHLANRHIFLLALGMDLGRGPCPKIVH